MVSPWTRLLLISLVSTAALASIAYMLFELRDGLEALAPKRLWAAPIRQQQQQQCDPFPEKQTFFHDLLQPNAPADPDSLLQQARHIVQADGGNAFVRIAEHDDDDGTPQPRSYGVSMFHALHCLEMIRAAVHSQSTPHDHDQNHNHSNPSNPRMRDTTPTSTSSSKKKKRSLEAPAHVLDQDGVMSTMTAAEHLDHCLDYLAQSIVCAGDDTLEPSFRGRLSGTGEEVVVIDGVGAVHQCRGNVRDLHEAMVRSVVEGPVRVKGELREGDRLGDVLRENQWGKN